MYHCIFSKWCVSYSFNNIYNVADGGKATLQRTAHSINKTKVKGTVESFKSFDRSHSSVFSKFFGQSFSWVSLHIHRKDNILIKRLICVNNDKDSLKICISCHLNNGTESLNEDSKFKVLDSTSKWSLTLLNIIIENLTPKSYIQRTELNVWRTSGNKGYQEDIPTHYHNQQKSLVKHLLLLNKYVAVAEVKVETSDSSGF